MDSLAKPETIVLKLAFQQRHQTTVKLPLILWTCVFLELAKVLVANEEVLRWAYPTVVIFSTLVLLTLQSPEFWTSAFPELRQRIIKIKCNNLDSVSHSVKAHFCSCFTPTVVLHVKCDYINWFVYF